MGTEIPIWKWNCLKPCILWALQLQVTTSACVTGGLYRDRVCEELISAHKEQSSKGFQSKAKQKLPSVIAMREQLVLSKICVKVPDGCLDLRFVD